MAFPPPSEAAEKWARRTAAAAPDYKTGVDRVTEAPGEKAARKKEKYRAGVTQSVDKWAERTRATTLEQWKSKAGGIGAQRFAQGAQANQDKYQQFAQRWFPIQEQIVERVNSMPDTTPEDRINKMIAFATESRRRATEGR